MLLEPGIGITGAGMSGQIAVDTILQAVRRARNRFVLDAHLPYTVTNMTVPPASIGMVVYAPESVYVHRLAWKDIPSMVWANLWRQDAFEADRADSQWTLKPGQPRAYSESESSPLHLQLCPPPQNLGILESIEVLSVEIDTTNAAATLQVPDEWTHAIKYQAIEDILSAESQDKDPLRAAYAQSRYQQAIDAAQTAKSLIRVLCEGVPLPLDTLANIDAARPYWRNQIGPPEVAGSIFDMLTISPSPNRAYGLAVDVVQPAPLPGPAEFIQLGSEDIPHIIDEVCHTLAFKCGGDEFTATYPQHDAFLRAAANRGGIDASRIHYLTSAFDSSAKEQAGRPDASLSATGKR
jgi:hypothetical protein